MAKPNDRSPTGRPSDDEIAKRAYELYLQRGSLPGYEVDDWLQAEAELAAAAARPTNATENAPDGSTDREPSPSRRGGGRRDAATPATRRSLRQ
jgi:hypothetical protein